MAGFVGYTPPDYLRIQSTSNIASTGIKCMVYGLAGSGKTRLMATAPGILILSAENGLLSLRQFRLPYVIVKTIGDLQFMYDKILNDRSMSWVQTIGLDSASEIAETMLTTALAENKDPRKAYGEMAQEVLNMLRKFRDIPGKNIIFIAKQGRITDDQTGGFINGPFMPGKQLDQHMPYMFDEVFQLCTFKDGDGKPYGALRTQRDNQNEAKDRSGRLDQWERPDLTNVFNKIRG